MNKEKLILIGGGGHCKSVIEVIELEDKFEIAGIIDLPGKLNSEISGYKILWNDSDIESLVKKNYHFIITLGQIKSAASRVKLFGKLQILKANMPVIISPLAFVSKHSIIGKGTVVMHHAIVNSGVKTGINCILNSKSLLEHDVEIGNHCHISTNSVINGETKIGEMVFVGSGSVINNNLSIHSNTVIGSGSVVIKNIESPGNYCGNPAKKLLKG